MIRSALKTAASTALLALAVGGAPAKAGNLELSFYGGAQSAPPSDVRTQTLGDDFVSWKGKPFAMPPYYGLRATWWQTERTGFGLDFNHAKVYADQPSKYGYERLEFTDGLNLLTANVWKRFDPVGSFTPYAGLGAGVAIPHVEVTPIGGDRTFGYQVSGPVVQWVLGASYALDERWSLFGEYKGTYSMNRVEVEGAGWMKTNIVTNALNLGVSFKF